MNTKYTHLLLFILTLISFRSFGQVFEIDAYNGQTVNTCKGEFTSSNGNYYDCIQGFGNGYRNNENYTVTFCSGTPGRPLRVSFISWDIEDNYDFLYVYDGNSTAAPLIATITGSSDIFTTGVLAFTSTGTCLTFRFSSDNTARYCGWDAIIGCQPTGCNGNLPAGDNCADAPQICDLDAYCGNTTGWYTSDATDIGSTGTGLFCGSIENNSWLKFVPSTTSASFEFTSSNCLYSGSGIQAMIMRTTDCNNFTAVSNCVNQNTGTGTFTLTTNTPLTPGIPYYLMIDGFGGNLCDYTVRSLTGIQAITLSSNAPICVGNTATITANNALAGTTYSWTPTSTIVGSSTGSSITVNPTTTTTYVLNAVQPNGCTLYTDSITVRVNPKKASTRNDIICEGSSVTVGTHTYTQTGTYLDTLRSSLGCDSVVTTNLTVKPKSTTNIDRTICSSQSVTIGSQTFNQTGNYSVVLTAANGCDSTVNLNLIVNPTANTPINQTLCQGESITVGSNTYTQTGTYTVTLQTSLGCDSVVNLNLTVNPKAVTTLTRSICEGESVTIGNNTYTETGNYSDTLSTSLGCDSVVNLNLTKNLKKVTNLVQGVCIGQSVTIGSQTYTQTGSYSVVLQSSAGCDSTVNLDLTVTDSIVVNINQAICQGESFTMGGQTYNTTGTYTADLQSVSGCDSTIHLNLTVNPKAATTLTRIICEGESVTVGNNTYTETGNYSDTLSTSLGCDSVVNLNLTKNLKKITNLVQGVCIGQSVTIGSQTYTQTGSYSVVLQSSAGCDSTVNLDLTVSDSIVVNLSKTLCQGESYSIGSQTYTTTGSYTADLQSVSGCDSIVHLDLTIVPAPTIDATANPVIVSTGEPIQLGVTTTETLNYSWTPAGQLNDPLAQNPTATITTPTWFVVTATNDNECISTDSVFVDLKLDICTVFIPNAFSPNGDGVNDIFKVRSSALKSMSLIITNRWGNVVFETKDINSGWDGIYKGQPAEVGVYGYYFVGECIQGDKKTLKGSITLLK